MEMYDARAYLAQDGPEAFCGDLIRDTISEFDTTASIGSKTVHGQAINHIFAWLDIRRRDRGQISTRRETMRQSADIYFCPAADVGEECVGDVQNRWRLQISFDSQVPSRGAASRRATRFTLS